MSPEQFDSALWFVANAFAAGLVARLSKRFNTLSKAWVPWLALASGYVIMLLKLGLLDGVPWYPGAVWGALAGVAAGGFAVLGHEAGKPFLTRLFGEGAATAILGKLPKLIEDEASKRAKQRKTTPAAIVFVVAVACVPMIGDAAPVPRATPMLSVAGCSAAAKILPVIAKVLPIVERITGYLKVVEASGADWFEQHPDEALQDKFDAAMGVAKGALATLKAGGEAAEHADRQEIDAAFSKLQDAYEEIYTLVEAVPGFLDATHALAATPDHPIESLPTPADLRAQVQATYGE